MIGWIISTIVVVYTVRLAINFHRNLRDARASGIKYRVVPVFSTSRLWMTVHQLVLPLLYRLPHSWTHPWVTLIHPDWGWIKGYEPFREIGADTFLTVSPARNMLYTAEASVISQITSRRNDFPKALEVYKTLRVYGNNVVTTEGEVWKHHRRIVNPPFSEKNNMLVWQETLQQCRAMTARWFVDGYQRTPTLNELASDAMQLSLHIISKAGFGVELSWPGQETAASEKMLSSSQKHGMTFTEALTVLLHNIIIVIVFPKFLLRWLPFQRLRQTYTSYVEWGQYMHDMLERKKRQIDDGHVEQGKMDLMLAMLQGATTGDKAVRLTDEEILGNVFVFLLAGHETTAGSMLHTLVFLAMNPSSQKHLQRDIDATFDGRPINQWDYEKDIPVLLGNMAGAVMNEQLRLIPPANYIPKITEKGKPQTLDVGGQRCVLPQNTYISLVVPVAHRNPHQWPSPNDLEEFRPERWLLPQDGNEPAILYKPEKGAYLPFSEGHRSCIGRRFAQVEILAFLAFIFSQYSVELSVQEWHSDEEVARMNSLEKSRLWVQAREKTEAQIRHDMISIITNQLRHGFFGLRLVKRGYETWPS